MLDFNTIISECGVGNEPNSVVAKNIANLEEFYDSNELTCIYNYCLLNLEDPELLIQIIKYTDSHRADSTLAILLEILQQYKKDLKAYQKAQEENPDAEII